MAFTKLDSEKVIVSAISTMSSSRVIVLTVIDPILLAGIIKLLAETMNSSSSVAVPERSISKLISRPDLTSGVNITSTDSSWFSSIKGAENVMLIFGASSLSTISNTRLSSISLFGELGFKTNCSGPSKLKSSTTEISTDEDNELAGMIILGAFCLK